MIIPGLNDLRHIVSWHIFCLYVYLQALTLPVTLIYISTAYILCICIPIRGAFSDDISMDHHVTLTLGHVVF